MSETHDWIILYQLEDRTPIQFCEIRAVGSVLNVRRGKPLTWGEKTQAECGSRAAALARLEEERSAREAEGWKTTRTWTHDPSRFDFDLLETEIRDGAREAFGALKATHPGEPFAGFALITDESAMTIAPAAAVVENPEDREDLEFLWNPGEWSYFEGGEHLDVAFRLLLSQRQDLPSELPFEELQEGVFEAGVRALEALNAEGVFGSAEERERVVLLFDVTDSDPNQGWVDRLNPPGLAAQYREWVASWDE